MNQLTKSDKSRYDSLKGFIKNWWSDMDIAKAAMLEIREKKLYLCEYLTFAEFCEGQYGLKVRRVQQLLLEEKSRKSLQSKTPMRNNCASGNSEHVQKSEEKEPEKVVELDEIGNQIPDDILQDWNRSRKTAGTMVSAIQKIINEFRNGLENRDKIFREFSESIIAQAEGLRYTIKAHLPAYAVCYSCHGKNVEKCDCCSQRGFVSKYFWDSPGAKQQKALISKNK